MKSKLKIAEPCHENWNEMTPVEKGKHCSVCAKQVVDFTDNSRTEITDYLNSADGQTCGRFRTGQIDVYGNEKNIVRKTSIPIYKAAVASILALLGVGSSSILAQDGEYFEMGDVAYEPIEQIVTNNIKVTIQGQVKSNETSLENAKISIYSGGNLLFSQRTKNGGNYSFDLEKETLTNNRFTIKVFAAGHESKTIENLEVNKPEITLNISMEHETMIMGKIMVQPETIKEEVPIKKVEEKDCVEYTMGTIVVVKDELDITKTEATEKIESLEEPEVSEEVVGKETISPVEVTIYPNPSASQVFVRTNKKDSYKYGVTDLNGKLIFSGNKIGKTFELNFTGKPNGIYLISIYKEGKAIETKRVIISH